MFNREKWTRGTGTSPVVKGLVWFRDGSRLEGTGAVICGQSVGRSLQFFMLKYVLSWYVLTKCNFRVNRRSTWVFALTARRLWKLYRPPEQRLNYFNSAKRREWYLYPAYCGAVLGPWTCCGKRKRIRWQARKRRFSSEVCFTWAGFGSLQAECK